MPDDLRVLAADGLYTTEEPAIHADDPAAIERFREALGSHADWFDGNGYWVDRIIERAAEMAKSRWYTLQPRTSCKCIAEKVSPGLPGMRWTGPGDPRITTIVNKVYRDELPEWEAVEPIVHLPAATGPVDGELLLREAAQPAFAKLDEAAHSRWIWRTPSEAAAKPPLVYFDRSRAPKGVLPKVPGDGCAIIVYGPKGSNKTGFVLKECLDAVVTQDAKVLYLAAEGGHGIDTARLPAACRAWGLDINSLSGRWHTFSTSPNLMSDAEIDTCIADCQAHDFHPDIVAIDTITRAAPGADINHPSDAAKIIGGMERLAYGLGGATVIGVTHPGKDKARGAIGSAQFVNLAFAVWEIEFTKETGIVSLYVAYMKDGPAEFFVYGSVEPGSIPVVTEVPAEKAKKLTGHGADATIVRVLKVLHDFRGNGKVMVDTVADTLAWEQPVEQQEAHRRNWMLNIQRAICRKDKKGNDRLGKLAPFVRLDAAGNLLRPYWFKPWGECEAAAREIGVAFGREGEP